MEAKNESDLDYLRRLRGQLIIAQTGLQALTATYKEIEDTLKDTDTSTIIFDLLVPLTKLISACETHIKNNEDQIEQEKIYPRYISKRDRLVLIFFNSK